LHPGVGRGPTTPRRVGLEGHRAADRRLRAQQLLLKTPSSKIKMYKRAGRKRAREQSWRSKCKMIKHRIHREIPNTSDRPTPAAIGDARITAKPNSVSIFNQTETHLHRKKFPAGQKPSSSTRNQISRQQDKIRISKTHRNAHCLFHIQVWEQQFRLVPYPG